MLVVDDDDEWRAIAVDVLTDAGFVVTTAADGRAGLASWRRTRADVVVTDVQMPLMNGCVLLAALRCIDRELPVIVLTGEDLSDAASTFAGAFRVIQKPVPPETIVAAVTDALLRRRLPRRRKLASAARAIISLGRTKGHAAGSRAAAVLRAARRAERSGASKRRRPGLAVAGLGAAAAVAVLIAAIRGMVV